MSRRRFGALIVVVDVLLGGASRARGDEAAVAAYQRREDLFDTTEVTAAQVTRFSRPQIGLALSWSEDERRGPGTWMDRVSQGLEARAVGPWGPSAQWQGRVLRSGASSRQHTDAAEAKTSSDALEGRLGVGYRVLDRYLLGAEAGALASATEMRNGVGGQGQRTAPMYALAAGMRTDTLELALGERVYSDKERHRRDPREIRTVSASARWFVATDAAVALTLEHGPGDRCCRPAQTSEVLVHGRWLQAFPGVALAPGLSVFGEVWVRHGDPDDGVPNAAALGAGARANVTPLLTLGAEASEERVRGDVDTAANGLATRKHVTGHGTSARVSLARAL